MSLRAKLGLRIAGSIIILTAISYAAAQTILLGGFIDAETQAVQRDAERALNGLAGELSTLAQVTSDYGSWDDTYEFIADPQPGFIETNLVATTFGQQRLNVMAMINSAGQIVFSQGFDLQTAKAEPLSTELTSRLTDLNVRFHSQGDSPVSGVMMLSNGPLLLAIHPILTSRNTGPARGALVMGRYLNADLIGSLARTASLSLTLHQLTDPDLPGDIRSELLINNSDRAVVVRPIDDATVRGYVRVNDLAGQPAFVFYLDNARSLFQRGQNAIIYFLLWLIGMQVVGGVLSYALLARLIQSRQRQHASEERFRSFIEQSIEGMALLDAQGVIVEWNAANEQITGIPSSEALGQYQWDIQRRLLPPERYTDAMQAQNREHVLAALTNGQAPILNRPIDSSFQHLDGSQRIVRQVLFPIRLEHGYGLGLITRDVTDSRRAEADLRHRIAAEELLAETSTRFINVTAEDIDAEIQAALQSLGEFAAVDRAYVFRLSDQATRLDNTHEWCAPGIEPQIDKFKGFLAASLPWWMARLARFESIHIPRVADLPFEAAAEKAILQQLAIQSIVVVPMTEGQQLIGFVGFDSVRGEKTWPEADVRLLRIVAETLANALARQRAEQEIRALNESLEQRVLERTRQLEAANQELGREVFERARAETAWRESESFYHSLSEVLPMPLCRKDLAGRFTFGNRLYCEGLQLSLAELIGKTDFDLHPRELAEKYQQDDRRVIESGQVFETIEEHQTLDGRTSHVQVVKAPIRVGVADGVGVGSIIGVQIMFWDITEQREHEKALRESEERFRQMAENMHEVFWMTALDPLRVLYVSPVYEEIWGRSCESVYANPAAILDTIYAEDLPAVSAFADRVSGGQIGFVESRIVRPDGSIGWVWVRAFPIRNAQGEIYRVAGIAENVSERKRAEEELRRALAQEKELSELKSRFISMASHDFRTPLATILSSTELLERYSHKLTDERKLQHLQQIQASVKQMTGLLEDVLIIGRADAGKIEFKPEPVELEPFCRQLVEELQLSTGAKHTLRLTVDETGSRTAMLDVKLLRQILTNLLSNAIKYSPQGGEVNLTVKHESAAIVFQVADQGLGIPAAAQPRLFETFHRADNVGSIPGTGLGLAIVKKSVDLHYGTIEFESKVGVGTTFVVRLPDERPLDQSA